MLFALVRLPASLLNAILDIVIELVRHFLQRRKE